MSIKVDFRNNFLTPHLDRSSVDHVPNLTKMQEPSGVALLLKHNEEQSLLYASPDADNARRLYRSQHPTAICALKCMDGRVNLSLITNTPTGLIQPWRNLGGRFNFGWGHFYELIRGWQRRTLDEGRNGMILLTYHFSKSNPQSGCKGWGYDTEAAIAHTEALRLQCERIFGSETLCPVRIGIETDEDALIIHGRNGEVLDMGAETNLSIAELELRLFALFPHVHQQIIFDLLPLLTGNIEHINEVRLTGRSAAEADHREWVLAVGRGFDWLHLHNTALIVGPFADELSVPIQTAAGLLQSNVASGATDPKERGIVIWAGSPAYAESGSEWEGAIVKAQYLAAKTMKVIQEHQPGLAEYAYPLVGTISMSTRRLHRQPFDPEAA